ncbi:MAG: hypothetical protein VB877_19280 [Pirellulaceae bacterium]
MVKTLQQGPNGQTWGSLLKWFTSIVLLLNAPLLYGQNPNPTNPFGDPAAPAKPAANPLLKPRAAQPSAQPVEVPLVVRLLRESNPTTPFELTRAVQLMVQTSQLKEAKQYLVRLAALKMSPAEKANLQRDYGTAFFLRISLVPELQPEGSQLAELVADASYRRARDPLRIAELIARLKDPAPEVRLTAMEDLKPCGDAAVVALANILADPTRSEEFPVIRSALMKFSTIAHEPLLGYLQSSNVKQQLEIINLLGQLGHPRSTMYLVRLAVAGESDSLIRNSARLALLRSTGAVPSQHEAELFLRKQLAEFGNGLVPVPADSDGLVTLWQWNSTRKTSVPVRYERASASLVLAAQTATELYSINQQNPEYRRLYLVHILGASKRLGGLDVPLSRQPGGAAEIATKAGVSVVHDVFQDALASNNIPAAMAAAEVLALIGTPELLSAPAGKQSALAKTLLHSNRRMRFTAMQTILQLNPKKAFPGASHVTETLGYFIAARGTRTAFVGHPLSARGQFLTGMLNQAGYRAEKALVGKSLLELVRKQTDCDLVLISNTISNPSVGELIQRFRDDPRTAAISIGILADPNDLERVRMLATLDPLTDVVGRPHTVENLAFYLARLEQHKSLHRVTPEERIHQARQALGWFARLAENQGQYPFYDLLRQEPALVGAVTVPALTQQAAPVLGSLGTAKCQQALVNTASRNGLPLSVRLSAQRAFDQAVQNHRLLLTRETILLQYDRYNASASLDRQTQNVLGAILDTIERRAQTDRSLEKDREDN